MKKTAISCLLVLGMGLGPGLAVGTAAAAQLTPQEQQALDQLRTAYTRQMGRPPTPEEEEKLLDQWRSAVMASTAAAVRLGATAGANPAAAPAGAAASGPASGAMAGAVPAAASGAMAGAVPAAASAVMPVTVQSASGAGAAPGAALTEEALAAKLAQLGPAKLYTTVERSRDGLRIDGVAYLDPEGKIESHAYDVLTGDLTYALRSGRDLVYKFIKAGAGEAVPFARASLGSAGGWQVTTATGQRLAGDTVTPTARGLLVARGGALFLYEPGKGGKGFAVPDGWAVAQFQRGHVGGTRFILLERLATPQGNVQGLVSSLRNLGATAGIGKKEDYALMNIDDGRHYPLNVQVSAKLQAEMANCRKGGASVSECAAARSFESLYTDLGRNYGHYYWKADWYATPSGPVAVTMENGVADIYVLDLATGRKVNAFHRTLGITSFDSEQAANGVITIRANWMMQDFKIDNAVHFLQTGARD